MAAGLLGALFEGTAHADYGMPGFPYGEVYKVTAPSGSPSSSTYEVHATIDTATEIAAGRMKSDCSDVRVEMGNGCAPSGPISFYLASGSCNTGATNVFVSVTSASSGSVGISAHWGNPSATSVSNEAAYANGAIEAGPGTKLSAACALPNGAGPCSVANEATVCQSGSCSPNAGVCIPSASAECDAGAGQACPIIPVAACASGQDAGACVTNTGTCAVDSDCAHGKYCDTASFTCATAKPVGAPIRGTCPSSGISGQCASGLCNEATSTCASPNGAACTSVAECESNVCDHGVCGFAAGDGPCEPSTQSTSCRSGYCAPSGTCTDAGQCASDGDCMGGAYCNPGTHHCAAPQANGQPVPAGVTCEAHTAACVSGECNAATDTCGGDNGAVCSSGGQCMSGVCGANGLCGWANGTGSCTGETASKCQSGTCDPSGKCVPASAGACASDSECSNGQYCDRVTFSCKAPIATGGTLPADGAHACGANSTTSACASGVCNHASNSCVAVNGDACSSSAECASGACGKDGKCGLVTGQPDACSGTEQCRTGYCGDTRTCVMCQEDYECGSGKFCNENHACHNVLPNAASCVQGTECASGVCEGNVCGGVTNAASSVTDGGIEGSPSVSSVDGGSSSAASAAPSNGSGSIDSSGGCSATGTSGGAANGGGFLLTLFGLGWVAARRRKSTKNAA